MENKGSIGRIELNEAERAEVEGYIRRGKANARSIMRGHIVLKSADGWSIERITETYTVSKATVSNVRARYRAGGVSGVLKDKVQKNRRRALSGEEEAVLVAVACSPVPEGHDHWTLRMLRDKLIELELVEHISAATVQNRLKKNELKPWRREHWCLPKKIDVAFVGAMEDVLSVYELPYDADYPQVSLDEKLVTLHADVVEPLGIQPGQAERVDYEYERLGTANLFVMVERLAGYRHVEVTDRRTAADYARQLQWLADVRYPDAQKIRLVQDNLNMHRLANLYLVFPPAEAFRLSQRFELHYTPKHGSWLNMAEIEIGVFERACLQRRLPSLDALRQRVAALEAERNAAHATINWRFATVDARSKLARLYPKLESDHLAF